MTCIKTRKLGPVCAMTTTMMRKKSQRITGGIINHWLHWCMLLTFPRYYIVIQRARNIKAYHRVVQDKRPVWWVYFGDMKQNRLITVGKVNDLINEKTVMLQFQAPPKTGQWAFQVFVKSDSHVGCDALCELKVSHSAWCKHARPNQRMFCI